MRFFKKEHPQKSSLVLTANSKMGYTQHDAQLSAQRLAKETGCDVSVPDRGVYVYYKGDGQTETAEFWPDDERNEPEN